MNDLIAKLINKILDQHSFSFFLIVLVVCYGALFRTEAVWMQIFTALAYGFFGSLLTTVKPPSRTGAPSGDKPLPPNDETRAP